MLVVIGRTFRLKLTTYGACPLGVGQGRSALWRPLGDGRSGVQFQKAINQLTPSSDTPNVSDRNSNSTAPLARCEMFDGAGNRPSLRQAQELWEPLGSLLEGSFGFPWASSYSFSPANSIRRRSALRRDLLCLSSHVTIFAGLILGHSSIGTIQMFAGKFVGA